MSPRLRHGTRQTRGRRRRVGRSPTSKRQRPSTEAVGRIKERPKIAESNW